MKWYSESHLKKSMWFSVGVMALALSDGHAVAQCELDKLLASDGAADDHFGTSVSISGPPGKEVAIVGAWGNNDHGLASGSAYIYRFNGVNWVEEVKLLASDGTAVDSFGWSVSISGTPGHEIAVVGAQTDDDNGHRSGSAYIYRFNGVNWIEEAKLLASDGAALDRFGFSVSISVTHGKDDDDDDDEDDVDDKVAIVGAHRDDDNGFNSGSAYIYRFNGLKWIEEQKLIASDGAAEDAFGVSVSISSTPGNRVAIVGAKGDDDNGLASGSAYIYRKSGANWVQEAKLLASDGAVGDLFGGSVSISGAPGYEVAIVGAEGDNNDNGTDSGSAYIYRFNGVNWIEEQKLLASDGSAHATFGFSVSISGDITIVGSIFEENNGTRTGSAYIYRFNGVTWVQEARLLASDGSNLDTFGFSVSISDIPGNEVAIVGGPTNDDNGRGSGSAYIFGISSAVCCPADLNGDGVVDVFDLIRVIQALFTRGDVAEDLDGDGVVTFRDVHIVIQSFGSCDDLNPESCPADLNGDGIVDVHDLLLLLGSWGLCPGPCPSDLNGDGAVNVSDFLQLLAAWGPCP